MGNPSRAEKDWPGVVVAGAYHTGALLLRNLVRRGLEASLVDWNSSQPGFKTVYGKVHQCPNPDEHPAEWADFMCALAANAKRAPVLIATADQFVLAIAKHAARLAGPYVFCHSGIALQAQLSTKEKQYEIAAAHGMPVPRTEYIDSLEKVAEFAASARFPCILKPVHFLEWQQFPAHHPLFCKKLIAARSARELVAAYELAAERTPQLVAQEVIEGPDTAKVVYLSCYSLSGERIANCMMRELRTSPIHYGSASLVEPMDDPEVDGVCDRFLRSIGYTGLCEIELKRDSRDGCVKMIEANPRYTGTGDAAAYAGVDWGWLHYLDLIGQRVEPVSGDGRDFRHFMLLQDVRTMADYRRAGLLSWGQILRSYRPPVHFFDLNWGDWRIAFSTLWQVGREIARQLFRAVFPKKRAAA